MAREERLNEFSEADIEVLHFLRNRHNEAMTQLYQSTCQHPSKNTIRAVDALNFHGVTYERQNLAWPLQGSLTMKTLRLIDRHFPEDEAENLADDDVVFFIGNMAHEQHCSRVLKTLIVPVLCRRNYRNNLEETMRSLLKEHNVSDVFEKETVVIPCFFASSAFLTVVQNPSGALVDNKGHGTGKCEVFHFIVGDIDLFRSKVSQCINKFFEICADREGKTFIPEDVEATEFHYEGFEKYDRTIAVLKIMNMIISQEGWLPDMEDINEVVSEIKTAKAARKFTNEYRAKLTKMMLDFIKNNHDRMINHLLAIRNTVIQEHDERQKKISQEAANSIVTLD